MKEKDYEILSFIQAGKRRKGVLEALKEKPLIPKEIAKKCNISISNVSNTIPALLEKELIECINPKSHTYKYFQLTKKGKDTINSI